MKTWTAFAQYRVMTILMLVGSWCNMTSQTTSGSITGAVVDSSGLAIPGANVLLDSETTSASWTANTETSGVFVFSSIPPGEFRITVTASGFRPHRETELTLNALETLSVGSIMLQVSSATTTAIMVTAGMPAVQTVSTEHSAILNGKQTEELMSRGRDYMHLLEVLPGVSSNGQETISWGSHRLRLSRGSGPNTTRSATTG